jgi:hypothetical protein
MLTARHHRASNRRGRRRIPKSVIEFVESGRSNFRDRAP